MTTRRRVWIAVGVFAVLVAAYYPFSPAGPQQANMTKAEQHIRMIRPLIDADPRFAAVRFAPLTSQGGCLDVSGAIATEADMTALRTLVAQSRPPVEVVFHLYMTAIPATQP